MAITIYNIAREAGVSAMTVSMALRGDKRVRDSTRQRVVDVARRLGYTPNSVARALVSGKTRTVGVYCQRVHGPLAGRFVSSFSAAAAQVDYAVALFDAPSEVAHPADAIRRFRAARLEGMAIVASRLSIEELSEVLQPEDLVVLINSPAQQLRADAVYMDDYQAGYQATQHLLKMGHQRIAFVGGDKDDRPMVEYLRGRRDALGHADLDLQEDLVTFGQADWFELVPASVERLLATQPRPTAIVCPHDRLALLTMLKACQMGLDVPGDLAVVGYYDLTDARLCKVQLTTFDVKVEQIGRMAFELLHERLSGTRSEPKEIPVKPQLIVRASCGAARAPTQLIG